jgi:small conductance mechanosensitive channel
MRPLRDSKLRERVAERTRHAQRELAVLIPLIAGILVVYSYRVELFGIDTPVRMLAGVALVILGWAVALAVGRIAEPALSRRDIDVTGPVGFVVRLLTITVAVVIALRIVGLDPATLAAGGAVTAVVLGLAAQQTLGNVVAGVVLLSARPFRVGERVRFQAGALAGQLEGVIAGQGLLYTTLARGQDQILVPNSVVLNAAVVPLREPAPVNLRVRLRPGTTPSDVQSILHDQVTTPLRSPPDIALEELTGNQTTVRVVATPTAAADGPSLANEVLAALASMNNHTGDE